MQLDELKRELAALADEKIRDFSQKLNPGCSCVLGVRVPQLRALAVRIAAHPHWAQLLDAMELCPRATLSLEERTLYGLVVGAVKGLPLDERLGRVARFVPLIDCWAVCDVACSSFKFTKKSRDAVFRFLQPYLHSSHPFELRFAVVMLLGYWVDAEHIGRLLPLLTSLPLHSYYVQMAVAWALSVCYVKFPDATYEHLRGCSIDSFTLNKTVQKITDSLRVGEAEKERARGLRLAL